MSDQSRPTAKRPRPRAKRTTAARASAAAASATTATPRRTHDLVVFGATGFTGSLVAKYLASHAPAGTRIALAGRSEDKLLRLRDELGGRVHDWPLVVANIHDRPSLDAMAASATAVVTTVGPYGPNGLNLVGACARAGTHYADLTGEVLFMRDSIDKYDDVARESGARIVHACGFDSIPSDIGVLALHLAAKADDGEGHLGPTHLVLVGMRGGVSGGTIHSMFGEIDRAKADPDAADVLADPYSLSPDRDAEPPGDTPDTRGAAHDDVLDKWTAPFPMAAINTRVVRRSNAIAGYPYGTDFRYDEAAATAAGLPGRVAALGIAVGSAAGQRALRFGPTRWIAEKILPDPGEGPGEQTRQKGWFDIAIHTRTPAGVPYLARVAAKGDPGHAATAQMLSVAGLTLAGDAAELPDRAGVLTPATAMGKALLDALKVSGMTITAARR